MGEQSQPSGVGYPRYVMHLTARQYEMGPFGHINYAVYLNYLEQAAAEHHAALGLTVARMAELGAGFTVRDVELHYHGTAAMGDELAITTWLESCGGVRAVRCSEVRNATTDQRVLSARVQWVWVNLHSGRPQRLSQDVLDCIYPPAVPAAAEVGHA
jgi:YbgC/YbaW family acyl-CoA thioester hydrolase